MKSFFFRNPALSRAAVAALGLALIVGLGTPPAAAQFVCVGNLTGATVPNPFDPADGATASAALSAGNVACGRNANASGTGGSSNAAYGYYANASGTGSSNTATGANSNASGDGSFNVAMGNDAQAIGNGTSNTAIGSGSRANFANSAAFGAGATATRAN